ncbi:YceK/YidQ family lipoprotein [Shewanella sp. 0m-8]
MKVMFVTLLAIFISGCSTVVSKIPSNSAMGIPYSGTKYALVNTFNCNLLVLKESPPLLILSIPLSVVDLGSSMVADTVLLPIDLLPLDNNENYKQKNSVCTFHLDWR